MGRKRDTGLYLQQESVQVQSVPVGSYGIHKAPSTFRKGVVEELEEEC